MDTTQLLAPLIFIMGCLLVGGALKRLLSRISIPYTVGLFVFGIVLGVLEREHIFGSNTVINQALATAGNLNPDLILYLFLPILIFSAAYELDVHIFNKTLTNASLLSVPGVIMAMFMTAAAVMGIASFVPSYSAWTWQFALMFGALISATDPVAVVALLKELGTSKRFSTLIDAESMLNDGTGIVLFMLFFAPLAATTAVVEHSPVVSFITVVAGGAAVGFVIASVFLWFVRRTQGDALLQNSAMILAAYLTFLLAQDTMNVSGVIALVAFGLTIAYVGNVVIEPKVSRFMSEFWDLLSYIANTLIFIIVGVIIAVKVHFSWVDLAVLVAVYIALNVIRHIVVLVLYPLMVRSGYGLSKREAVILSWGGLRGALGLTLALMVSYTEAIPEPVRRQVLFLTAGVVTLTLLLNATTIKWLLEKLGLMRTSSAKVLLDYSVRKQLYDESAQYFESLKSRETMESANWTQIEKYLPQVDAAPDNEVHTKDVLADMRLRILSKERSTYWMYYNEGVISLSSLRKLSASVDQQFDKDGRLPLCERQDYFNFSRYTSAMGLFKGIKPLTRWIDRYWHRQVINGYDLARGLIKAQKLSLKLVEEFAATEVMSHEQENIQRLRSEIESNIAGAQQYMNNIAADYPISYRQAVTKKGVRMLKRFEHRKIEQFFKEGMLSEDDAQQLVRDIDTDHKIIKNSAKRG